MQYGYYMPNFGVGGDARALADLAREAEQAGWDGLFLWDHIEIFPRTTPTVDPWIALTAIAMRTERLRFGPMVTPVPRRNIPKLARETVTLDRLSGGRLIFGAGGGFPGIPEYTAFGDEGDKKVRGAMLDEGLTLLDALWSGEPVGHKGEHYTATTEGFDTPVQKPRIPIWVAASWPFKKPFRRAAQWDGVVPMAKDAMEGGRIAPDDLAELVAYTNAHRSGAGPFDVTQLGFSQDANDTAMAKAYADAGATWWLEMCMPWGTTSDDARTRVRKGPPRF